MRNPLFLAPDWYTDEILGIEIRQLLGLAALVVVAVVVQFILVEIIKAFLKRRYEGADAHFWNRERRRLTVPFLLLTLAVTFIVGFPSLDFDRDVERIVDQAATLLGAVAMVLVAYRAIDILTDVLADRAEKTENRLDDQLIPLLNTTLKVFVTSVGILFVLQNLEVNITSLIAGLGIGGLAIALAAQDTIRNLLGGITIFADRPFQVGDWVIVEGIEGTVEHVGFRSSRVRTFYNSLVTVPNASVVNSGVDNMGMRRWRRYKTTLGIAYHSTPDQIQAFVEGIRALIRSHPGMRTDYYIVEFHGFGASALEILVYCFIDAENWNDELRIRHVLNLDIMRLAEELNVEFAFPTQTIHVAGTPETPFAPAAVADRAALGQIVESFGPDGKAGQRGDQPITSGYDNG